MKYLVLIILVGCTNSLNAQTIDSIAIKQVDSLIRVSRELTGKKDLDKALEVNGVAEKLALEKLGRESAGYGSSCLNRGKIYYNKANYPEAEKWYLEAKIVSEITFGKAHADYTRSLIALAELNQLFGYYEKSEPLFIEAIAIGEKVFGRQHLEVAGYISGLASLYFNKGDYGKAEVMTLEAKAIRENISGKDDISYAKSLSLLGSLNSSINNNSKAENYLVEAKEFYERKFGKENIQYCASLVNLANLYKSMGNLEKSELCYLEAKNIYEVKLKIRLNPFYVNCIGNLGHLYNRTNKFSESEFLLLEVKKIFELELGNRTHPYYLTCLGTLADVYYNMGDFGKAESLYLEAKEIFEKAHGNKVPEYIGYMHNMANFYEKLDRISLSEPLLEEVSNLEMNRISKAISFLSEQELANYINAIQWYFDRNSAYLLQRLSRHVEPSVLPTISFDNALFYKGFLLIAGSLLNSLSIRSPEAEELNNNLKSYRRLLGNEYTKPLAERKGVKELEEKANDIKKELARSVAGYAEAIKQVKWQDVQSSLKSADAVIEFISFKKYFPKATDSIMYAVLLLKSGDKQPQFIPLFEEKSLDSLLHSKLERKADYVNALYTLADRGAISIETPKKSFYEILWKPLEEELTGIKTIYFSPSGLLHRINLDAIPISETETLADRYNLIELNSTRQLVIPTQIKIVNNDAIVYGGILYEQDSILEAKEPLFATRTRGSLTFSSVDSTLRGGTWNYLAGTEREVNAIEKTIQSAGVKTNLKKGYLATEESFKNIGTNNSPSPRILHIATHGYFFPDPKSTSKVTNLSYQNEPVFKMSNHPMLRSGLIMAGGNAAWQGKQTLEGREDGILTAYEISQMNLSNTELVVLSACETGLGDIQGNEGVYGLQRAFKIAGAKYLIMSLWQVPDKQTSLLMTTFYKKWLEAEGPDGAGKKMSIPDAFHAAQKELSEAGLDPYQWAGFVLVE